MDSRARNTKWYDMHIPLPRTERKKKRMNDCFTCISTHPSMLPSLYRCMQVLSAVLRDRILDGLNLESHLKSKAPSKAEGLSKQQFFTAVRELGLLLSKVGGVVTDV